MKKVLSIAIIVLVALIAFSTNVSAADISSENELISALSGTDTTITLKEDIDISKPIEIERNVTIDLNGYIIKATSGFTGGDYIFGVHRKAHLTIKDSGTNGKITNNKLKLVVVKLTVKGEDDATYSVKFTLDGGILEDSFEGEDGYSPISGNGYRKNTEVTINGGKVISKMTTAIYQPQEGKMTVNGGYIEGITGIEIRAGSLEVNDGTIVGTEKTLTIKANGNGSTTKGAGIAIAQHTTVKDINVDIKGGTIKGYVALSESNPQNNNEIDKISVEVSGGDFSAINGGTVAIKSETKTGFITGGTFSSAIDEKYLTSDVTAEKDENGEVIVGTRYNIEVKETKNGTVKVSSKRVMEGDKIILTTTPEEGYELASIKVLNDKKEVKITNGTFIMPDGDATVEAEFKEIIKIDEDKKEDEEEQEDNVIVEKIEEEANNTETEETINEQVKDETPKMGVESVAALFVAISIISMTGLVILKKRN